MRAVAAGLTDVGKLRAHNEDRFVVVQEHGVFVVADGMGGHQAGEVASTMATNTVAAYFRAGGGAKQPLGDRLRSAVLQANSRIFTRSDDSRLHHGMGTTVVAAAFAADAGEFHVVHAGDSRCYRMRGADFAQITRDHSLISDALLEEPDLTASELMSLPRNVITRALGIERSVDLDAWSDQALPGDLFLLCSDGLHGMLSDDTILAVLREGQELPEACTRLVDMANEAGGNDNITALLVRIDAAEVGL